MNKCITVLDKAAQEYAGRIVGNDEDSNYAEWFNVYKEKFADMLIAETIKVMQQEWYDLNNTPAVENESPRDIGIRVGKKGEVISLMHKIKTHFGVTE